jgi:putative oxidoreductase
MSLARRAPERFSAGGLGAWLPVCLRVVVVVLVVPAAALKFVDYGGQAAFFAEIGVPLPAVTVLVVGAVQLCVAAAVALGVASRLAALVMVPIMVTAMTLYAVVPSNAAVLLASLGVVALGPGKFALWDADETVLDYVPG